MFGRAVYQRARYGTFMNNTMSFVTSSMLIRCSLVPMGRSRPRRGCNDVIAIAKKLESAGSPEMTRCDFVCRDAEPARSMSLRHKEQVHGGDGAWDRYASYHVSFCVGNDFH